MVVGLLVVVAVAGMVVLWPSSDDLPPTGEPPPPLVDGRIVALELFEGEPDEFLGTSGESVRLEIELTSGPDAGDTVRIETPIDGYPPFDVGDEVKLATSEVEGRLDYFIVDFERRGALGWLLALFVGAVLLVGRWHGLRSLIGLALSLLIITRFVVPAILAGSSPGAVALVGALAVMLVSLYLAHGVNEMTTTAVVGTALALGLTIGLGMFFIDSGELTGYASEEANIARFAVEGLDLKGLVLAGLIIAALGVLDDVTVSQASTVFQLHEADRRQSWGQLFTRAMNVGRDHIASVVNTLFLAYAGASLALLVVFSTGGLAVGEIVSTEVVAEEIVKTVVGSLGIIVAVPFTTALAVTLAVRRPLDAPPLAPVHSHDVGEVPGGVGPREADGDDEEQARRSWSRYLRDEAEGPDGHSGIS